jgi:hypothetical protein
MRPPLRSRVRDVRRHRTPRRCFGRIEARVAPLGVTFLRTAPAPAAPARHVHSHVAVGLTLRPRLVLSVGAAPTPGAGAVAPPAVRTAVTTRAAVAGEQIVARVQARGVRVESGPAGPAGAAGTAGAAGRTGAAGTAGAAGRTGAPATIAPFAPPRPAPVGTVVRRREEPAVRHAVADPGAVPDAAGAAPAAVARLAPFPAPPGAPAVPLDVGRITDDVIAALDRRIVAQRERLGRM